MTYHVVCHDCKLERLFDHKQWAGWCESVHSEAKPHNVEYAQIE